LLRDTDLNSKAWRADWSQHLGIIAFVFIGMILPIALLPAIGGQPLSSKLLWSVFIGSMIGAPLLLSLKQFRSKKTKEETRRVYHQIMYGNFIVACVIFEQFLVEFARIHDYKLSNSVLNVGVEFGIFDESTLDEIRRVFDIRNRVVHSSAYSFVYEKEISKETLDDISSIEDAAKSIQRIMIDLLNDKREDIRTAAQMVMGKDKL
jgi:hypothetical protein